MIQFYALKIGHKSNVNINYIKKMITFVISILHF